MASIQFPTTVINALGIEVQGLCWGPGASYIPNTPWAAVDGLGLQTGGLVWNFQSQWFPPFVPQNVVWTGCSTCSLTCG